jgi:hypothetical protein
VNVFRDEEIVRIVTTNFDTHFTTAARERFPDLEISVGPALPLGRSAKGSFTYMERCKGRALAWC